MWYVLDAGWSNFRSVNVNLAGNRSTAELTVTDYDGASQTAVVRLRGNPDVILAGGLPEGHLLKMSGDPADYGLSDPGPAEGEPLATGAVDAVFSGPDA
jgi:hypothetical protein